MFPLGRAPHRAPRAHRALGILGALGAMGRGAWGLGLGPRVPSVPTVPIGRPLPPRTVEVLCVSKQSRDSRRTPPNSSQPVLIPPFRVPSHPAGYYPAPTLTG